MPASALPAACELVGEDLYCIDTDLYRPGLAACYLLRSGERLAFIETGPAVAAPRLLALLAAMDLRPEQVDYVIPTHVHLDHAGAAGDLLAACPHARLYVHPKGAPHLIDPDKLIAGATAVYGEAAFAQHFGAPRPIPTERVLLAEDGGVCNLAGRPLQFIDTPGHANHHGCLFDARTGGCFSGDTFGIAYRELATATGEPWLFAPTTPVAFDPPRWLATLDRLMALQPRAMFLTHYGRLDHPERHVGQLRASIAQLAELALGLQDLAPEIRPAHLHEAVCEALCASARASGVARSATELRALLAVDCELNAQGLEIWLRRRAAASA